MLTVLMLIFGRVSALAEQNLHTLGLIVLSAAIGISVAHVLMYYVLSRLGAIIESGAEMMTPFVTFSGAALIFGERLSALQWMGGLGVIVGCALMIWPEAAPQKIRIPRASRLARDHLPVRTISRRHSPMAK